MEPIRLGTAFLQFAREHVPFPNDSLVIDIGCGSGRMAEELELDHQWRGSYLGIEPMASEFEEAKKLTSAYQKDIEVRCVDIRNEFYNPNGEISPLEYRFPAEDQTVDILLFLSVFTHLPALVCRHYIRESRRVLKRGGAVCASWFFCDESKVEEIKAGVEHLWPSRCFRTRYDEGWVSDSKNPLSNIAFPQPLVEGWYIGAGLTSRHLFIGDWVTHAPISQDAIFAVSE